MASPDRSTKTNMWINRETCACESPKSTAKTHQRLGKRGGDGGDTTGIYSGHQKHWGAHNNHCWLKTQCHASTSNTSTGEQHPSGTDAVGECGHYRIKIGHGAMPTCRFHDYGNAFRYENV